MRSLYDFRTLPRLSKTTRFRLIDSSSLTVHVRFECVPLCAFLPIRLRNAPACLCP